MATPPKMMTAMVTSWVNAIIPLEIVGLTFITVSSALQEAAVFVGKFRLLNLLVGK